MAARRGSVRRVTIVTTGRSDYGLLRPLIDELRRTPRIDLAVLATGMHLSQRLGWTWDTIEGDGLAAITEPVQALLDSDQPAGIAKSIGLVTLGFAQVFERRRPDVLVVLGDRFETLGAVAAAVPFKIAVAHIHGGEVTQGAIDEGIRHAISKMSHLHFVSAAAYGRRLQQMGEERWRITVSGAPGLDGLKRARTIPASQLSKDLGIPITRRTLLVTYHPETLAADRMMRDLDELLAALEGVDAPLLFTMPNADAGRDALSRRIAAFVAAAPDRALVGNLGPQRYRSAMARAGAMVGNSSSGLIEAPSFELPVVNIGDRQRGRIRARNVIDVQPRRRAIDAGIRRALDPAFRRSLAGLANPYGDGGATRRIARVLASVPLDTRLFTKRFVDR